MGEARPVVVALVIDEDLRLVLEAPKGGGVDDPVAVTLIGRAETAVRLGMKAPPALLRFAGIGGERDGRCHCSGKLRVVTAPCNDRLGAASALAPSCAAPRKKQSSCGGGLEFDLITEVVEAGEEAFGDFSAVTAVAVIGAEG